MSQARALSRRWVSPNYAQGVRMTVADAVPAVDAHYGLLASRLPGATEQTEFDSSAALQVGHQLAIIGDEFNRTYCGKAQDTTPQAVPALAPVWSPTFSFIQTGGLSIFRSLVKCFTDPVDGSWVRRLAACGTWIPARPASTMCRKVIPAALLLILFGLAVKYGLPN